MNSSEIRELATAFQKSRIFLTAYELDIFTYIGEKEHTAGAISKALTLNARATERLLNALVALKFLEKKNGQYSNRKASLQFLSKNSPGYIAAFMHTNHLWRTWSHLTEVIRTGKAAHDTEINARGDEWLEAFISAMHDRAKKSASQQLSKMELINVNSVLDVGGGSGAFSMAFVDKKPGIKAAVFDLPNVIPITKKFIEMEGYSGKIDLYKGDYTTDELPKGFDLVFLSAIVHSNSFETNRQLVKKCYQSLNAGGRMVIQDWIMDDAKTEPVQGAVFAINMLVGTEQGDCFSENEVKSWYENAGFMEINRIALESGVEQMIGTKLI